MAGEKKVKHVHKPGNQVAVIDGDAACFGCMAVLCVCLTVLSLACLDKLPW